MTEQKAELGKGMPPPPPSRCRNCGHTKEEHKSKTDTHCLKEGCICPSYRYDITGALTMLGVTAGLTGMLLGGMGKMGFGLGFGPNEGEMKAKEVLYVFIDGFMGYYETKVEEIRDLNTKLGEKTDELERQKEMYEEMKLQAQKNLEMAEQWKSKYLKATEKKVKK